MERVRSPRQEEAINCFLLWLWPLSAQGILKQVFFLFSNSIRVWSLFENYLVCEWYILNFLAWDYLGNQYKVSLGRLRRTFQNIGLLWTRLDVLAIVWLRIMGLQERLEQQVQREQILQGQIVTLRVWGYNDCKSLHPIVYRWLKNPC